MTERQLSLATQFAIPAQPSYTPTAPVPVNDALHVHESVDEEPYTIKCICDYLDDDGNTIYCETCDTWQHIECFYPGRVEDASRADFDHSCADCMPRQLDRNHATDRQRYQRQNKVNSDFDKKSKRPPSKSHKKKLKPAEQQSNGHDADGHKNAHQENNATSRKSKSHRSNQSISSSKRSPPDNPRSHSSTHPLSPAHTPPDLPLDFQVHSYSDNFLALFEEDGTTQETQTNSFASLSVTNRMSSWLQDPKKLEDDAGVKDKADVFQNLIVNPGDLNWPDLRVERKYANHNDVHLQWRYLLAPTNLPMSGRIGELTGMVGFQSEYCSNQANRYHELTHPRPFVFFHPRLPLCIDTRKEGSVCRYVRRSCRANTTLETFIANGSEYHFWLISERNLKAHEQITIAWDFRFHHQVAQRWLRFLNLSDEDVAPTDAAEITDEEYHQLTNVVQLVLSDYGGCACDLGHDCAFARFHRSYYGKLQTQSNGNKGRRGRKTKHPSHTSTGHATNSRAASEQQDPYEEDDDRSVSGSYKSKPHSRDMTPAPGSVEVNGILTETTDREKRKLAALEDTFRKMEQGQPPRKKKRASDATSPVTTAQQPAPKSRTKSMASRASVSHSTPSGTAKSRSCVDASTSRRQSRSPLGMSPNEKPPLDLSRRQSHNPVSTRTLVPPRGRTYKDTSTQTEKVENQWYSPPNQPPKHKKSIVSLSQRLLKNRLKIHKSSESVTRGPAMSNPEVLSSASFPWGVEVVPPEADRQKSILPVESQIPSRNAPPPTDAPPTLQVAVPDSSSITLQHVFNALPKPSTTGPQRTRKETELRVAMPVAPIFPNANLVGTSAVSAITSVSASGSVSQSPFGTTQPLLVSPNVVHTTGVNGINGINGINPSPVKKKISLSDYKARLKKNDVQPSNAAKLTAGGSPTVAPVLLKAPPIDHTNMLEGSVFLNSPEKEKPTDPLANVLQRWH